MISTEQTETHGMGTSQIREFEKVFSPFLLEGAQIIRSRHPDIFASITIETPQLIQALTPSPSGPRHSSNPPGEKEHDSVHRNRSVLEAQRRANFLDRMRSGRNFFELAARSEIMVPDYQTEQEEGELESQPTTSVVRQMQRQTSRALCVDQSRSMKGGGDILARLITTAYLLDCAEHNVPLTVRLSNQNTNPLASATQADHTVTMRNILDLPKAADVAVTNYKPDMATSFSAGITELLTDLGNTRIAPQNGSEIVFVTDGELDPNVDTQERIEQTVKLAREKGIRIKVIYLKDDNVLPTGPDRLRKAGCDILEINLSEIMTLPENVRNRLIDRTQISVQKEKDIDLVEVYQKAVYWLTYLCGASAVYLAGAGGLRYLTNSIDPKSVVSLPPFGMEQSADALHMLLALDAGLQALTLLLKKRKAIFQMMDTIVDVPSVETHLQNIKLRPPKEHMTTVRYLEIGSEVIIKGEKRKVEKGDRWEINDSVYEAI